MIDEDRWSDEEIRRRSDWPKTARKLSGDLRRLAPNLQALGVKITFDRRESGGKRRRLIQLERVDETPSLPSQPSQNAPGDAETAISPGRLGNGRDGMGLESRPARNGDPESSGPIRDGRDGRDGILQPYSKCDGDAAVSLPPVDIAAENGDDRGKVE